MKENPKTDNVFKKKYYFYTTFQNKCGRLYVSIRGKADFSQESVSEFSDVLNFQIILALKVSTSWCICSAQWPTYFYGQSNRIEHAGITDNINISDSNKMIISVIPFQLKAVEITKQKKVAVTSWVP